MQTTITSSERVVASRVQLQAKTNMTVASSAGEVTERLSELSDNIFKNQMKYCRIRLTDDTKRKLYHTIRNA